MAKREKTKAELRAELAQLRARLAAIEAARTGDTPNETACPADPKTHPPSEMPTGEQAHSILQDGVLHGSLGMNVDITDRERAEAALREAVEFSERLMASMLDGVSVLDCEGVHVDVNDAFCRMTGFAREELLGAGPPHPYWPPEHQAAIREAVEEMRAERVRNLDLVFMRKSGERFPAIVAPSVVRDASGAVVRYMATVKDITDRKRAETALREANATLERRVAERTVELAAANELLRAEVEHRRKAEASLVTSERRFRNYFEQGLIGMVVTSFDKRWVEVNDRGCEILGYPREELLGTTWAELTHPDDLAADVAQFERLLAGKIEHYSLRKRFLRKDGGTVHTIIAVRLFRDEDGSFDHVVCLIQDITEQKRAEEALWKERETLKHLLQASDRERRLIAYDLHDGLAQHLAAAIMQFQSFDALKDAHPQQADTAYAVGVEMARQAHAEARRLISGVRPPILDEAGLIAAIDHLVNDPLTCPNQEVRWHSGIEAHRLAPMVENALFRMVQEGLGNARRHSRSATVKLSLVQKGDLLELTVEDRGVGFDPATVSDECFGLRSIRERARLLGGKLVIRSRPGRGTCLRVTLPVSAGAEQ